MTDEQKKAVEAVQAVVNFAVNRGLFENAASVVLVSNAMATIVAGLESKEQPKS